MKRAALFFLLLLMLQYPMLMSCYGDVQGQDSSLLADLTLLSSYESKTEQEMLVSKAVVLSGLLDAEKALTDKLIRIQSGDTKAIRAFERDSLLRIFQYKAADTSGSAFIFNDAIVEAYEQTRRASLDNLIAAKNNFDRITFLKAGPADFERFFKQIESKPEQSLRLTLLLQDKLMDKAKEENIPNKEAYFEEVLALRLPQNKSKLKSIAYQVLESRARLHLLEQLLYEDRQLIEKRLQELRVKVYSSTGGSLDFSYTPISNPVEVKKYAVYVPAGESLLTLPLGMLVMINGDIRFQSKKEMVHSLTRESLLDAIQFDNGKRLFIDLDAAVSNQPVFLGGSNANSPSALDNRSIPNDVSTVTGNMKSIHSDRMKEAGMIMTELRRYEIYLSAKQKGIANAYTNRFAKGLPQWKINLSLLLRQFKPGPEPNGSGMPEYYMYIRQYTDFDNDSILQLREQALQFMNLKEGCLWILDMLYKTKYDLT